MRDLMGIHYSQYTLVGNRAEHLCNLVNIHKTLIHHFLGKHYSDHKVKVDTVLFLVPVHFSHNVQMDFLRNL